MAFNLTAGNPRAHRIRVYYTGSDTIYEGMALCYDSDATTNWFGGSVTQTQGDSCGQVSATTTTAEGSQNEGKYIRVEQPANDNLLFFAGVVAKGGWVGQTGPRALDVYVPNGAIVPVRSSILNYEGETVLALAAGDYEFQTPVYDTNRTVACAIAMEDVDRSSTEGLCLAKLFDPCVFTYNSAGFTDSGSGSSQRYELGAGISSGTVEAMRWMFNYVNTGGEARSLRLRSELKGAANGGSPNGLIQFHTRVNSTSNTGDICGLNSTVDLSGTTVTISSGTKLVGARVSSGLAGTNTVAGNIYALHSVLGIAATVTFSGVAAHTYYEVTGGAGSTDAIFLFHAASADAIDASAATGDTAHDSSDYAIPVRIGSSTYYIIAQDSKG